jgi:hypothetical protein
MPDLKLKCLTCESFFVWREEDQYSKGSHAAKDCPEGLDQFCPGCSAPEDPPLDCPSCRVKQDGQRS